MNQDDILARATTAAYDALRDSGVAPTPASAIAGAIKLGRDAVATITEAIAEEYRERACDPEPWYIFHAEMARMLPRIRWIARLHHRRMARRYKALMLAGRRIACQR